MKSFFRSYWKSILIVVLIAYASLLREVKVPIMPTFAFADKWVHLVMYLVLTLTLKWDAYHAKQTRCKQFIWCVLFPIVYGGVLEILQHYFFPPRTGEWSDWLADIVGVLMGVGIGKICKRS